MLRREWRCCWRSADRRCSNYIWVIDNFIAYLGASYIGCFTVYPCPCISKQHFMILTQPAFWIRIRGWCHWILPMSYISCHWHWSSKFKFKDGKGKWQKFATIYFGWFRLVFQFSKVLVHLVVTFVYEVRHFFLKYFYKLNDISVNSLRPTLITNNMKKVGP